MAHDHSYKKIVDLIIKKTHNTHENNERPLSTSISREIRVKNKAVLDVHTFQS